MWFYLEPRSNMSKKSSQWSHVCHADGGTSFTFWGGNQHHRSQDDHANQAAETETRPHLQSNPRSQLHTRVWAWLNLWELIFYGGKKRNLLLWAMSLGWKKSCYSHDKIKTDKHVQKVRLPVMSIYVQVLLEYPVLDACQWWCSSHMAEVLPVVCSFQVWSKHLQWDLSVHFEHQLIIFWRLTLKPQQECCSSELIPGFSHGWPVFSKRKKLLTIVTWSLIFLFSKHTIVFNYMIFFYQQIMGNHKIGCYSERNYK